MSLQASGDVLLGTQIAQRYRIESVVGRGGMATVYRAVDTRLDRPVAVKVLAERFAADQAFVSRFLEEARTAASFSHPNLAHVYDSGSDGVLHFIVLEMLQDHRSLRSILRQSGPLPPLRAIGVVLDVLAGLEPIHDAGLIHCDVKSGNVMIGPDGAKLIDFGIARPQNQASDGTTSLGSLHAMSPEQLRGDGLTSASDIFAVGVVLYEALTGRVPFPGENPDEVSRAHEHGPVAAPSTLSGGITAHLDDVALQALRVDPTRRFVSASAMSVALRSAMQAQREMDEGGRADETTTVHVSHPSLPPPAVGRGGPRRRNGAVLIGISAAALAVPALVAAMLLWGGSPTDGAAQPTTTATPAATVAPSEALAPGQVRVPDTIGMTEAQAERAAREAGLNWRIEWQVRRGQKPGIYDQEPPAGSIVREGSRFVMYAYRNR